MKLPIDSYRKLFNTILLDEYPQIEKVEVNYPKFFSFDDLIVKIHLKEFEEGSLDKCRKLGVGLKNKLLELTEYFGKGKSSKVIIYLNGKKFCDSDSEWVKK